MTILVINSGSSSVKYAIFDSNGDEERSRSVVNLVTDTPDAEREKAIRQILEAAQREKRLFAIGHRLVHGGDAFRHPTLIDVRVAAHLRSLHHLAPLHNPAGLMGIDITLASLPHIPQVAVFDTAFFSTLPEHVWRYALPKRLTDRQGIRRYGFHGISHQFVTTQALRSLDRPIERLRLISLHLGNGASIAAIKGEDCIETSMGMTPLEGLVMGTRAGDLDPSILIHLQRCCDLSADDLERLLNRESGLLGLCGDSDMRIIRRRARDGEEDARLAISIFVHRVRKYLGAYTAVLGGLDGLVFTGGIGENDTDLRSEICHDLDCLGIRIDPHRNAEHSTVISPEGASPQVMVIPTNEELAIARETRKCLTQ
ncbi:MAG: acetate kinase [Candidatus Thiodiazotropha sp.]